jgi:hypothetical protein
MVEWKCSEGEENRNRNRQLIEFGEEQVEQDGRNGKQRG